MKSCFGYIRVSTQKQGEGVSLQEQKSAISTYADVNGLAITHWFEEKETAAKGGRPIFNRMLKELKRRGTHGLVIHKIDRSARNLRDWSAISELADAGLDVYFATESLDFRSRGGRLTADIQAVIAADYIRNLREETIKGLRGRLKQGLYPFMAPVGYLDQGGGKPKIPDPKTAPLVRELFDLYATGQHTYRTLIDHMTDRGLYNQKGRPLSLCGIETILRNPFYAGLIRIKKSGETIQGIHQPLITMALFNRVQEIRENRGGPIVTRHRHLFRRLFKCGLCGSTMIPELQKGHCYYRCKNRDCPTKTVRQDVLDLALRNSLQVLEMRSAALRRIDKRRTQKTSRDEADEMRRSIELRIADEEARLARLEELVMDGTFTADQYKTRKSEVDSRMVELRQNLDRHPKPKDRERLQTELAELQKNLCLTYELANDDEKRVFIESVWPNRRVVRKNVELEPSDWLQEALSGRSVLCGGPVRGHGRTLESLLELSKSVRNRAINSTPFENRR